MTKYGPSTIKDACNLFLVTGDDDGINSNISKQVCLMVIFLRMDRLSCQTSPNSIAASFLHSVGLEQKTPLFSFFLTARVYACVSWCDKNIEPQQSPLTVTGIGEGWQGIWEVLCGLLYTSLCGKSDDFFYHLSDRSCAVPGWALRQSMEVSSVLGQVCEVRAVTWVC